MGAWLQSKFNNHGNQFVLAYQVIVIRIELLKYITTKFEILFIQQAFGKGNELGPGNNAVTINVKDIK